MNRDQFKIKTLLHLPLFKPLSIEENSEISWKILNLGEGLRFFYSYIYFPETIAKRSVVGTRFWGPNGRIYTASIKEFKDINILYIEEISLNVKKGTFTIIDHETCSLFKNFLDQLDIKHLMSKN